MAKKLSTTVNTGCSQQEPLSPVNVRMCDLLAKEQAMACVRALRAASREFWGVFAFDSLQIVLLDDTYGEVVPPNCHKDDLLALAAEIRDASSPRFKIAKDGTMVMGEPIYIHCEGASYIKGCLAGSPPAEVQHEIEANAHVFKFAAEVLSEKISTTFAHRLNISEHMLVENELQIQYEKMLAVMEEKERFFRNVSHELRSPLTSIIGFSEMMEETDEPLTQRQRVTLARIDENARRLLDLVNKLLDLGKLEVRRMEFEPGHVKLDEVIRRVMDNMKPLAREKNLTLSVNLPADLPEIVTDEQKVVHILVNLLSNAIKFTPQGNVQVSALINCRDIHIVVADTGIGIPEDEQQLIFQEFYQGAGRGKGQRGSGLGLSIAQRMASLLGGKITVKSELGTGSTFVVHLPLTSGAR